MTIKVALLGLGKMGKVKSTIPKDNRQEDTDIEVKFFERFDDRLHSEDELCWWCFPSSLKKITEKEALARMI